MVESRVILLMVGSSIGVAVEDQDLSCSHRIIQNFDIIQFYHNHFVVALFSISFGI